MGNASAMTSCLPATGSKVIRRHCIAGSSQTDLVLYLLIILDVKSQWGYKVLAHICVL